MHFCNFHKNMPSDAKPAEQTTDRSATTDPASRIKSDIYAVAYAEVALASRQSTAAGRAGVFVVLHANGTIALVHPDTGHPLARYPSMRAVSLCGTAPHISDSSIVFVGHSSKLGVRGYRVEARALCPHEEGEGESAAATRRRTVPQSVEHPLHNVVFTPDAAAPFSVALTELCAMPMAAEAVTAIAVAYARPTKTLLTVTFDTSSVLRMWAVRSGAPLNSPLGSEDGRPPAASPNAVRGHLIAEREEPASPVLCMSVCRGKDLWCGYEDGSVTVYQLTPPTNTADSIHSERSLSPASRGSSFSARPTKIEESPLLLAQSSSAFFRSPSPLNNGGDPVGEPTQGLVQVMRLPKAARSGILSMAPLHRGGEGENGSWVGAACVLLGTERGDVLVFSSLSFRLLQEVRGAHGSAAIPAMCSVAPLLQVYSISTDQRLIVWSVRSVIPPGSLLDGTGDGVGAGEAAQVAREADVSLVGDVTGAVYCLCYAAPIGTVAGGGTQSELLCWFPSDHFPTEPAAAAPNDSGGAAALHGVTGEPPLNSHVPKKAPTDVVPDASSARSKSPATSSSVEHREESHADDMDGLSPPRALPPSPTPRALLLATSDTADDDLPPQHDPILPSSVPTLGTHPSLKLQLDVLPLTTLLDVGVMTTSPSDPPKTDEGTMTEGYNDCVDSGVTNVVQVANDAMLRDEQARALESLRQNFAVQLDTAVLHLQAEASLVEDELHARLSKANELLERERALHLQRLEALRGQDEDVETIIAAYRLEIQHLTEDLAAARKECETTTKELAAQRSAHEGERATWASQLAFQVDANHSLSRKVENLGAQLQEALQRRAITPPPVSPEEKGGAEVSGAGAGGVAHLLEALTAELRRLKSKKQQTHHRKNTEERGVQTERESGRHDRPYDSSAAGPPPVDPSSIQLRRQLQLVETLLSHHQLALQPNVRMVGGPRESSPPSSTSILTSTYFIMRDVLGPAMASEVLEGVLSDSSTSEEELTELVVLQLCRRLRGDPCAHLADSPAHQPAADRAQRTTHPLLRGFSLSPGRR